MGQYPRVALLRRGGGRLLGATVLLVACRGGETEDAPPSPPRPVATQASSSRPVDRALPGELAEGLQDAFGLPIPRRMSIEARFPDAVRASGSLSAEQVANYVRDRVTAEKVETGPAKTVFAKAKIKAAPQRLVQIEVISRGGSTRLLVRDLTAAPAEEGLTPDEHWKKLGLTPEGDLIDPKRME